MSSDLSRLALADIIDREREAIQQRWLARVQRDIGRSPGVELTQLQEGLPDYLVALAKLLRSEAEAPASAHEAGAAWSRVAREHGITRVRIGFDITQLIHEFIVLKQVIREVARARGAGDATADIVLSDLLEAGICVAVEAYVETRDFELRRKQAEHIGFLTHELRNPLSTASLAASQLRRLASTEQLPFLDVLDRSHARLGAMIDGVLLTEKLEAGKVQCRPSELKLRDLLEEAVEGARSRASEKRLAFHTLYDPDLVVCVDPSLTRSAVQNLADNAVKYTDEGGVDIDVEASPECFVVHVRDTCHGLSNEELRTIFEPFVRGRTRKAGSGLGLAIARRAVEAQGGTVGAESLGALGCHFWIRLPRRVVARDALPHASSDATAVRRADVDAERR